MKLNNDIKCVMDTNRLDFVKGLEDQMQRCLDECIARNEKEIQNKVYTLLSAGFEPYQVIIILSLSLINNL